MLKENIESKTRKIESTDAYICGGLSYISVECLVIGSEEGNMLG